jgi:hypothetical protein
MLAWHQDRPQPVRDEVATKVAMSESLPYPAERSETMSKQALTEGGHPQTDLGRL